MKPGKTPFPFLMNFALTAGSAVLRSRLFEILLSFLGVAWRSLTAAAISIGD
jgi:hypothetical protein